MIRKMATAALGPGSNMLIPVQFRDYFIRSPFRSSRREEPLEVPGTDTPPKDVELVSKFFPRLPCRNPLAQALPALGLPVLRVAL